ncbi:retropepsin-like aspartic protease [Parabacteroides pacaensis]|uniref:retropepsin-like aspartic protease n=1 Tax=Parabacteroides pacaensis TaxID=2086575 RepID=UPI000D0F780C|nr:retropepsin-like aspartic protease [Parabacteroides pacaensis]
MRRLFFTILVLLEPLIGISQTLSKIQDKLIELAGQYDTKELPQLFLQYKNQVEPFVRYYCGTVISITNGDNKNALMYIDSLLVRLPHLIDKDSKTSFAYAKAKILQSEKRYKELVYFCREYITEAKLKPGDYLEKEILELKKEGFNHLHSNDIQEQLLQLANDGDPFELKEKYEIYKDSVNAYVRLNCERSLAQAFNNKKKALIYIDSLLHNYSSQMDKEIILNNLCYKADILFLQGKYGEAAEYVKNISKEYKEVAESSIGGYWAPLFKNIPSTEIIRPSKDCVLPCIRQWENLPVFPGKVNTINCELLFDTGATCIMLNDSLARQANIRILSDSVSLKWSLYDNLYTIGSLAIIDSLRIGNILLKNRMALIDYSSHTACDPNTLTIGIAEMESLGQIDFYPDKIVLPYSSLTEDKDPNFFLEGMTMKIPYVIDKSSYSFTFDTGSNINFFSRSLLLSSGQSSYNAYILIDRKPILLTELYVNDSKNVIGFPLIKLFPKFSINYNTMRLDFNVDSIAVPSNYWINRGDVFELETKLSKEDSIFYPLSKASVLYGKNKSMELLNYLDTVFTRTYPITNDPNVRLMLYTFRENALYDLGRYQETFDCLTDMQSVCSAELLLSLEQVRKRCKMLCTIKPQQVIWKADYSTLRPTAILKDEYFYSIRINGKKALSAIAPWKYENIISLKEAQRLKINILPDSIDFNGITCQLGVAKSIQLGKIIAKNVIFYVLPDETTATLIGQEFLHLIPFIDLSKEKLTLQVNSEEEWDNAIPIRWEKPHLIAKINSSKSSMIIKLEEGKDNVLPQSFSTQKEIQLGNIPISLTDCTWNRELDLYMDMRGTIGIYYLLENADRIIFNFKNMSMKFIK